MRILVTAGNTQAPIDRVRCITNTFTGRTGAAIAARACERGHAVTLLTSHPEVIERSCEHLTLATFRTFDDLKALMARHIAAGGFDAVIHCAAVSDYLSAGVFGVEGNTALDSATGRWTVQTTTKFGGGKIKSDAPELWLRLVRTPKLVDAIRGEWHFRGTLVKFKLEVGTDDNRLLEIAENSRRDSDADLMVANTLEGASEWAYVGPISERYERVSRTELPDRLFDAVELLQRSRRHG